MEILTSSRLSTLGHPKRLAIFRLLMRRYPDKVPAGELSDALRIKPSTLSAYLSALMHAGLIAQERAGTSLKYAIDMTEVGRTLDYLLIECCRGRPELCTNRSSHPNTGPSPMPHDKYNVLFICTGNSARSVFAESILSKEAADRFKVFSAGTRPYSGLNPFAIEVLKAKQHDVSELRAKNISEFQGEDAPRMDFVFTVCDRAANEECPAWRGQPISAHWGLPDPVKATGTAVQKNLAFQLTYSALRNRILAFAALPIASLDRKSLQHAVDDISNADMEVSEWRSMRSTAWAVLESWR